MAALMEIETKPTICILESFLGAGDFDTSIKYYDGDMKSLPSIA